MLLPGERATLKLIQDQLSISKKTTTESHEENRRYFDGLRKAFRLFEDIVFRINRSEKEIGDADRAWLFEIIGDVILKLGGVADPTPVSIKDYDHLLYGPFLGISDDGHAVHTIRRAALNSPKTRVLGQTSPIQVGVAHDAERLAASGEVAVGPEEYKDIILGSQGSILISTNVGTRLNLRYYKMRPIVSVPKGPSQHAIKIAIKRIEKIIEPFINTPDGKPRPVTVLLYFSRRTPFPYKLRILKSLIEAINTEGFFHPEWHRFGLLVDVVWGPKGLIAAKNTISLAREAGITEVAIQGEIRWEAENKISMPGLLNYFRPKHVSDLLEYAHKMEINVTPKNLVDPDTVARNVWASLHAARNMGLHLGKYGLFPLTYEESDKVMGLIQRWFSNWAVAPAFYLDFPHIGNRSVHTGMNICEAAREWLDMVARHKIPIVLLDTADKDRGRKLLKSSPKDRVGILTLEELVGIDRYASERRIRCLWAGGITLPQALQLGKYKVFGVYVTTSATRTRPISERYASDFMLTAEREPTYHGVYRAKLLLEAGFLVARLKELNLEHDSDLLNGKAMELTRVLSKKAHRKQVEPLVEQLANLTESAWSVHLKQSA